MKNTFQLNFHKQIFFIGLTFKNIIFEKFSEFLKVSSYFLNFRKPFSIKKTISKIQKMNLREFKSQKILIFSEKILLTHRNSCKFSIFEIKIFFIYEKSFLNQK